MNEKNIEIISNLLAGQPVTEAELETYFKLKTSEIDSIYERNKTKLPELVSSNPSAADNIKHSIRATPETLVIYIKLRRKQPSLFPADPFIRYTQLEMKKTELTSTKSAIFVQPNRIEVLPKKLDKNKFPQIKLDTKDPLDLAFYESMAVNNADLSAWVAFLIRRDINSIISSNKDLLLLKMGNRAKLEGSIKSAYQNLSSDTVSADQVTRQLDNLASNIVYNNTLLHFLLANTCANEDLDKIIPQLDSSEAPHLKANLNALNQIVQCMEDNPGFAQKMVKTEDYYGKTPILLACMTGNEEIAKKLIELDKSNEAINKVDSQTGYSPLHVACILGLQDVIISLRNKGADNTLLDKDFNKAEFYLKIDDAEKSKECILKVLNQVKFFYGHQFSNKDQEKVVDFFWEKKAELLKQLELNKELLNYPDGSRQCVIS